MAAEDAKPLGDFVFVYGTLKQGQPNQILLQDKSNGSSELVARGQTVGRFPLLVATRFVLPFLLHQPGCGKHIKGEVIRVDSKMMAFLDDFEDHPDLYEREKEMIEITDTETENTGQELLNASENNRPEERRRIECWIYFLKKFPPEIVEVKELIDNYDAHSVPEGLYTLENDDSGDCDIYAELLADCKRVTTRPEGSAD